MMDDRDLVRVAEESRLVRAVEHAARACRPAAGESRLIASVHPIARTVAAQPGVVLAAATATHLALMFTAPPRGWYWLLLPGIFAIVAASLMFAERGVGHPPRE